MTFEEVTGYIDTVEVKVDTIEQEITTLPEEVEGIDLNNVEIILDFDTNIGIDFLLELYLLSFNDNGDTAEAHVVQLIKSDDPQSKKVVIPNAENLINIKPKKLIAFGKAKIGGEGNVTTEQYVQGTMRILVPIEITINEGAVYNFGPNLIEQDIPEQIEAVTINMIVNNDFDFGGHFQIFAAKDTLYFQEGSSVIPDTLAVFDLLANQSFTEQIALEKKHFDLFQDSLYILPKFDLLGREDGENSVMLKNDSLSILLYGKLRGLIDSELFEDEEEDEEGEDE